MSKSQTDQNSRTFDAHEACESYRRTGAFPSPLDVALESEERTNGGTSGTITVYDDNDNVVEVVPTGTKIHTGSHAATQ